MGKPFGLRSSATASIGFDMRIVCPGRRLATCRADACCVLAAKLLSLHVADYSCSCRWLLCQFALLEVFK